MDGILHPAQRQVVERTYRGPARVSGSAGTGKTIGALHRAVHLARAHPDARVLLTTFSTALADALRARVVRLIANEPMIAERLEVHAMADIGRRLYQAHFGRPNLATPDRVRELLRRADDDVEDLRFSSRFLWTEWSRVVDAWQLASWEQYRDVPRLGRRTRLPERQRERLWSVFSKVPAALDEHGLLTEPRLFGRLQRQIAKMARPPFEFCVVDEAQDIGVAEFALSGRPRRRTRGRPVLRRRPRSTDLPDAVLLARLGGRHPWALAHLAGQLPHLPSDPAAGGPAAAARRTGRTGADRLLVENTPASWLDWLTVRSAHMVQP